MSFTAVWRFFRRIPGFLGHALDVAKQRGLTDDLVKIALLWVRVAEKKYIDNAERREWVVSILVARGIPESLARLVTELAFQTFKTEFEKFDQKAGTV